MGYPKNMTTRNIPKNPVVLVKGGEKSPPVYRSDLRAWFHQGWDLQPEDRLESEATRAKISNSFKTQPKEDAPTYEQRELVLKQMQWQDLKDICIKLGISKPSDGWDSSIPEILKKEGLKQPK